MKRTDYITWDELFMGIAIIASQRSKDPRTQIGACIVTPDNKVVGVGYNGFPYGCSDDVFPWDRDEDLPWLDRKYPYVVHAEVNAILNTPVKPKGCSLYCTMYPCHDCAKVIIQSGIKQLVFLERTSDAIDTIWDDSHEAAKRMLDAAGVVQYPHKGMILCVT